MTHVKLVNLLNDFAVGGVTNGLRIFQHPELTQRISSRTLTVNPSAPIAPKLDADVILIHFPPRWIGLPYLATLRLRNPNARIVHIEHSYSREWASLHVPKPERFRQLLRHAFALADRVVAMSKAQKEWLLEIDVVDEGKISVLYPYGCDQGLARVTPMMRVPGQPLIVGSYGRFVEAKGFDTLVKAFRRLDAQDNIKLVLGGFGPHEAELRELAGDSDVIEFVGKVEDHVDFMQKIDVFAAPSRYETFGQIATEAREAGRPMLVSQAGGLPEQAKNSGIVVDCTSEDELLWSLRALHTLPLETMGAAGRFEVQFCIRDRVSAWSKMITTEAFKGRAPKYTLPQMTQNRHPVRGQRVSP